MAGLSEARCQFGFAPGLLAELILHIHAHLARYGYSHFLSAMEQRPTGKIQLDKATKRQAMPRAENCLSMPEAHAKNMGTGLSKQQGDFEPVTVQATLRSQRHPTGIASIRGMTVKPLSVETLEMMGMMLFVSWQS